MTKRNGISKVVAGIVVTGALTLTSVLGGVASADSGPASLGVGELQECTISKMPCAIAGDFDNDGDVDGRDFLIWQRGGSPAPSSDDQPTEEVSFYYNKIAFRY